MTLHPTTPAPAAALGYEAARDELVAIVARLEAGTGTLEESLALWERGEALAARCEEILAGALHRVEQARTQGQATGQAVADDVE